MAKDQNNSTLNSTADLPPSRPSIELDEVSGKRMTEAATRAVQAFAEVMLNTADGLRRGQLDGLMKIGFDFDVSMAYIELDLLAMVAATQEVAPDEIVDEMEKFVAVFGHYARDGDALVAGSRRMAYAADAPTTVRLHLTPNE